MADYPISNVPRRVQYVNTGVGPYLFNFEILTQTDIAVYRGNTLLTLTTDYTVTINSNGTGSITLTTAGTGNITIVGARAIQRTSDYTTNGDLFANTLNTDLDSQTIYSQQLAESLDRTIKVPITDASTINLQLPTSSLRANKLLGFTAIGEPTVSNTTLSQLDAAVSSFINATGNNASSIIYTPAGSGAVATTVQAKLREMVSVKDFGAVGDGVTNDRVAIQNAIDTCASLGIKYLYFDKMYIIGGAKHPNTYSILDWKQVSLVGPGGLKLADNTNIANSVFTATVSGTTMTVTAVSSGSLVANQFLTGTGLPVAVQIVTQLTGTPNGVGTYQLTASATIPVAITVSGVNRMVEMLGNYDTVTGLKDIVCSIEFDYNGANNCANQTIFSWNTIVSVWKGQNVRFDGAKFKNNCGSNDLVLGTITSGTPTIKDVSITNCLFENEGDRVNSKSPDYSSIFCIADGLNVSNNAFRDGPVINGCPWEVYGRNILIANNTVSGYFNTCNIVAKDNMTTSNVVITGNVIRDASVGFTLWATATTSKLYGITIANNIISYNVSSPGGPYFVNAVDQVVNDSDLRNIVIEGNVAQNFNLTDTTRTAYGISVKCFYSVSIKNNTLYGFAGAGLYLTYSLAEATVNVSGNEFINCAYGGSSGSAQRTVILIDSSIIAPAANVIVENNTINPLSGYTLTTGISGALNSATGYVGGNAIQGATALTSWTGTGVGGVPYALSLASGFTNNNTGTRRSASYKRGKDGNLEIYGVITCGTISGPTTIGTLPAGYRPSVQDWIAGYNLTTDASIGLIVETNGTITTRAGVSTGDVIAILNARRLS